MFKLDQKGPGGVPLWALILSLFSLTVPLLGDLVFPGDLPGTFQAVIWLFALVPALLLAYYRGWKGVVVAVAAGMATIAVYQILATRGGVTAPDDFSGVVVALLALALGIGWLGERLHLDRAQVEKMALTDLLTHLPNRRHARVFLENEFAAAKRGRRLSVVLFDLDSFKIYNDRYGHQAGDQALTLFAGILSQTTRRMNLSSRFGGEEFLSVLADTDADGALLFAERVRSALMAMRLPRGALTVSAGVAAFQNTMRSVDELLAAADHALYQAKREGRNRVRLFGRALLEEVVAEAQEAEEGEEEVHQDGYPWGPEGLGRSRPPITLLPHRVTGFGVDRRILVVEDEVSVMDLLTSYLEKEGFEVTSAGDLPSAIRHLGTEFDVVITDLKLPGRWGRELVAAVKARWPRTQVVAISGGKDEGLHASSEEPGADALLGKPFGMSELRNELQEALARRKQAVGEGHPQRVNTAEARVRSDVARQFVMEAVRSLVAAVEIRDPFTQGHHHRVTLYAQAVRQSLDPGARDLSPLSLALGTEFLDVGKIGVPEEVLLSPDPLTQEEGSRLRDHPQMGRSILAPIIRDPVALEVVHRHHEHWDGSGYPDGLAGEEIPLSARIAAVADGLDALTSCRAHRPALSWDQAVEEILQASGTRYDPAVVVAFQVALPQLREIWDGLEDQAPMGAIRSGP